MVFIGQLVGVKKDPGSSAGERSSDVSGMYDGECADDKSSKIGNSS